MKFSIDAIAQLYQQVLSIFSCSLLVALLARRSLNELSKSTHTTPPQHPSSTQQRTFKHVQYKSQPPTECGYCARIWFQRPVSIFNRWCTVRLRPSVLPIYFPLSVLVGYYIIWPYNNSNRSRKVRHFQVCGFC